MPRRRRRAASTSSNPSRSASRRRREHLDVVLSALDPVRRGRGPISTAVEMATGLARRRRDHPNVLSTTSRSTLDDVEKTNRPHLDDVRRVWRRRLHMIKSSHPPRPRRASRRATNWRMGTEVVVELGWPNARVATQGGQTGSSGGGRLRSISSTTTLVSPSGCSTNSMSELLEMSGAGARAS